MLNPLKKSSNIKQNTSTQLHCFKIFQNPRYFHTKTERNLEKFPARRRRIVPQRPAYI